MGNRISKTIINLASDATAKTTFYTRDAQGNTMAVYDNHFEGLSTVICSYEPELINQQLQTYQDDIWNLNINPNLSKDYKDIELAMSDYITLTLGDDDGSCEYQARAYILGLIGPFPSPSTPLTNFSIVQQIKTEVENNYNTSGGLNADEIANNLLSGMLNGEDPDAVLLWTIYFWNIYNLYNINNPTDDIANNLNSQGYTYINQVVKNCTDSLYWREQHLYGSSRVGMHTPDREVAKSTLNLNLFQTTNIPTQSTYSGMRQYELTNHLGNVLSTIKDEKQQIDANADGIVDYYEPIVINATDYYPFGMPMPNRTFSLSSGSKYRFGFNGKENDNVIYGEGNLMSAQYWEYDTRIGRRWNVDRKPIISISPYAAFANNPICYTDVSGDSVSATFLDENGVKTDQIPALLYNQFKTEYGILLGYNVKTSKLYVAGIESTGQNVSKLAKESWLNELAIGMTSSQTITTGFNIGFHLGNNKDQANIFGVNLDDICKTVMDLADFDKEGNPLGTYSLSGSKISKRANNFSRMLEHEFFGHGIKGLADIPNTLYPANPGPVENFVNIIRAQISVQFRLVYNWGISSEPSIYFGITKPMYSYKSDDCQDWVDFDNSEKFVTDMKTITKISNYVK